MGETRPDFSKVGNRVSEAEALYVVKFLNKKKKKKKLTSPCTVDPMLKMSSTNTKEQRYFILF